MNLGGYSLRSPIIKKDISTVRVAITDEGRNDVESYISTGPEFAVLSTLNQHRSLTIHALARETNITDMTKLKVILNALKKKEHVRKLENRETSQEEQEVEVQG